MRTSPSDERSGGRVLLVRHRNAQRRRGAACALRALDRCAAFEEKFDELDVPLHGGIVKRRAVRIVERIKKVAVGGDEGSHGGEVAERRRLPHVHAELLHTQSADFAFLVAGSRAPPAPVSVVLSPQRDRGRTLQR